MKAFVITLDALFALTLLFLVLTLVYAENFKSDVSHNAYLRMLSMDVVTVLEKTGRLNQAIEGNTSAVDQILETTPLSFCTRLMISDPFKNTVATIAKLNCNFNSTELQTTNSVLVYNGTLYTVQTESWYGAGPT